MPQPPWYSEGLRFSCTRCGNCCSGAPGFIWVADQDVARLAQRLGTDAATFRARYTRAVPGRGASLIEKPNHDCVFFERGVGCTVYGERPRQCRTWPFWRKVVADRPSWESAARDCPGMDRGALHDATAIAAAVSDDGVA
jgi:uncharacterized protein